MWSHASWKRHGRSCLVSDFEENLQCVLSAKTDADYLACAEQRALQYARRIDRLRLRLLVKRCELALQRCARLVRRSMFDGNAPAIHLLALGRRERRIREIQEEARAKMNEANAREARRKTRT
jgi:hypothetical protein